MTFKSFKSFIAFLTVTLCVQFLNWHCNGVAGSTAVFTADTLGFHGWLCSPFSTDYGEVRSVISCAMQCSHHSDCLGYFHSSITKRCLGVGYVVSSTADCSSAGVNTTYKLYRKSGGVWPPPACILDANCTSLNMSCVENTCQCVGGYKYNPGNVSCTTDCAIYGNTFTKDTGHSLLDFTVLTLFGVTVEQCLGNCSTLGGCRSANYRLDNGNCYMKSIVAFQSPEKYIVKVGVDHFVRNCA